MSRLAPRPHPVVATAVLFEVGLALVAVVLGWVLGYSVVEPLRWTAGGVAWGIVATVPLLMGSWGLSLVDWEPVQRVTRELRDHIIPLFATCNLGQLAVVAVAAGLGEELLFRGVLQRWLVDLGGPLPGLVAASVLFGLAHLITRTYAVLAALVGLYLGGLFLVSGNLLVPVVVHAVYDLLALVYLVAQWKDARREGWGSAGGAGGPME